MNVLVMLELSVVVPRNRKVTVDLSKSERLMNFFSLNIQIGKNILK